MVILLFFFINKHTHTSEKENSFNTKTSLQTPLKNHCYLKQ